MEPTIRFTGGTLAVLHSRREVTPVAKASATPAIVPAPDLSVPERGTTGPVPIGDVLKPLQRIIAHPDRGRLLAKFCEHNL